MQYLHLFWSPGTSHCSPTLCCTSNNP